MSKVTADCLSNVMGFNLLKKTAHVQNRYIGEGGRLISDIVDITNKLNINNYLVSVDTEKSLIL